MVKSGKYIFLFALLTLVSMVIAVSRPDMASAELMEADAICVASRCTETPTKGRPLCATVVCRDSTNGFTTVGFCKTSTQCQGTSAQGLGGGSMNLGGQLGGIVGQLFSGVLQKLMGGSSGSGSGSEGGTGSTYTPPPPLPTCNIYSGVISSTDSSTTIRLSWSSTDATTAAISPGIGSVSPTDSRTIELTNTTTYVLSVTGAGGSNVCSTTVLGSGGDAGGSTNLTDLLNSFNGSTDTDTDTGTDTETETGTDTETETSVSTTLDQIFSTTNVTPATFTDTTTETDPVGLTSDVKSLQTTSAPFGTSGDIRIFEQGATIVAGMNDPNTNTQVVGFYGANSSSDFKSTGVVGQLCVSRPWATNILSKIITPSFFDSLCTWRGYQVGVSAPAQQAPAKNTAPAVTKPSTTVVTTTKTTATTTPVVPGKVDVWAVPAVVPLGARTSIFWNTQAVTNCIVSSPDGSFNQTTLSGGAATVPLSGATTFTISCIDSGGNPVTDFVTVNLAI